MKKRESFNTRWGFILACIGSAVGMGNIWMFPTRVSLYGGGAFLIPYFIFVALIGFTGVIGEMKYGIRNAPPPYNDTLVGNIQIFPIPTAEPMHARINRCV